MTKSDLKLWFLDFLAEQGFIKSTLEDGIALPQDKQIEPIKPTHGSCCTCQTCGRDYDDCVCSHNELLAALDKYIDEIDDKDL